MGINMEDATTTVQDLNDAQDDELKSVLPDWPKRPTLNELQTDVKAAKIDYDEHISQVDTWFDKMYVKKAKVNKGQSQVAPKLIRKQAEWRYASLTEPFLSTPDLFNVYPISAGDVERAKQNELVLNNQFNTQLQKVKFIDSYIRDAVDIGTVIVKVGWDSEEEEVTTEVPVYEFLPSNDPALLQKYQAFLQMQQQDPEQYLNYSTPGLDQALEILATQGQLVEPQQTGVEEVTEIKETKNQPTVEVYNYKNLITDSACNGDISKAEFVCEVFKSSIAALTKDGKYFNLDKINIEGASPLASEDYDNSKDNNSFNFTDRARKQFTVHTYWGTWDIDGTGIVKPIVVSWVGDTIIRMEENPYPDKKHPFISAVYMPVRNSMYGEPDGELLGDNQDIIGAVTRGMLDLLGKSANGQIGIRRDMLDTTNMRKFQRGDDYVFNGAVDPRQGFHTHVYPEIPQSAYNMITMQNTEAESLTGIKAFSSGISGQALGDTATGIRSALDATSKRELGNLRRLAEGILEIGRKIISMNAVFLSEEEVVRVTATDFVQIRRDDLAGSFDLRLSISTAEEDNKKAEELAFMLQTMGNNMDAEMSKMILSDIARLRKMPELAKKIEDFQPQPDPMVQMEQQLKIKLLEAQVQKEQTAAQKNMADAKLSMARMGKETTQGQLNLGKTETELAKARKLGSDADRQDLDYLEEEGGVHQARQIEQLHLKHAHSIAEESHKSNLAPDNKSASK